LIGTATLPVSFFITYFLIFRAILFEYTDIVSYFELIMFLSVIFLPAFLIIFTRFSFARLGWFFVYLLALPVWQLILPLWAFWHFDDFSWGDTRKVQGDKGGDEEGKVLDASTVPLRRWEDYERAWRKSLVKKRQTGEAVRQSFYDPRASTSSRDSYTTRDS
jgi:chitin synthase